MIVDNSFFLVNNEKNKKKKNYNVKNCLNKYKILNTCSILCFYCMLSSRFTDLTDYIDFYFFFSLIFRFSY